MKVTAAEWMVIVDTLRGSLIIRDRTDIPLFGFTPETREGLMTDLIGRLGEVVLESPPPKPSPEQP